MVHFCIFSGHQAQLRPGRTAYITLFGALDLRRPPVAAQFVELRREAPAAVDRRWCFFMTVFGGTTITWPTLADEYLALLDGVRIGALTLADWDAFAGRLCTEGPPHVASFTLFAELKADALPTEDAELDALALQRHAGRIPQAAVDCLMVGVGQGGARRLAAVRQAVAATLASAP